jgi:Cu/Ag efflux pump CusA
VQGLSTVVVEFEWGTDYNRAVQQIGSQLGGVVAAFPPGTRAPTIASATSRLGQVLEYYLRDAGSGKREAQQPVDGDTVSREQ